MPNVELQKVFPDAAILSLLSWIKGKPMAMTVSPPR